MLSLRKKIQGSCKLDGHTLEQVPSNPYLGVQIQEDLKWKEHINNVTKKASSTLKGKVWVLALSLVVLLIPL
jgi:hypothetical protein